MSNPFTTPFTCISCARDGMEIDAFPGPLCLDCHAAQFDTQPPVDVQALFRGSINL